MRENLKATVMTKEVIAALNALNRIGELKPKSIEQSILFSQNARVLLMEKRVIDARREAIVKSFPAVKSVPAPGGGTFFQIVPEGWDSEDPENNSADLRQEAREISERFTAALQELDDAKINVELRGLRGHNNFPEETNHNDRLNCYWLIEDFDGEPEKEKKPRRSSKAKEDEE